MDVDILSILQWAFPAGISIWQFILIRSYKRLNKAKAKREEESVWKEMYDSNKEAILNLNEDNKKMRAAVSRLERMVYKIMGCRYYDVCPVRDELQKYAANLKSGVSGQPFVQREGHRHARDNPCREGLADHPDDPPP